MKFRKELVHVPGSITINYRTGARQIVGEEVGIKVRMSGKCGACGRPRSRTLKFSGYINNGVNKETYEEAKERYAKKADDYIEKLESGERAEKCNCGGLLI